MGILSDLFGSEKIRAERATVTFGNSVFTIDGYRLLDNGEFRAGMIGSSELIGYERTWLSQVVSRNPKNAKNPTGSRFHRLSVGGSSLQ